jgi:hypothetical protein
MKCASVFLLWVPMVVFFGGNLDVAEAASLYVDPGISQLYRGDSVTMSVRLDVDEAAGECVNAVDAVISYSNNIEPVDVSIGDSILRMWVEEPTINRENRTITFAGGIPNGYCGRVIGDPRLTNVLTKIIFQSPGFSVGGSGDNMAVISFTEESTAYLNDGQGTKIAPSLYPAKIELDTKPGSTMTNPWKDQVGADQIPPETFGISLQRDEKAFSQKYYIVFSTTDKQTGVDHFEVMEEPLTQFGSFQWGRADAPWIETRSPYVLTDQSLNSIIRVKALDKAGNEYIATLIPDDSIRTLSHNQMISIVGSIAIGVLVLIFMVTSFVYIRRYVRKKRSVVGINQSEQYE